MLKVNEENAYKNARKKRGNYCVRYTLIPEKIDREKPKKCVKYFNRSVAEWYFLTAFAAFATEDNVWKNRYIIIPTQNVIALWAVRRGSCKAHTVWHTVDNHVQKASDTQSENSRKHIGDYGIK